MGEKAASSQVDAHIQADRLRVGGNSMGAVKILDPPHADVRVGRYGWREIVTRSDEVSIFKELSDERWDLRTIQGLSKATGLPEPVVRDILSKYPDLIRRAAVLGTEGRELFTIRERPVRVREKLATLQARFADIFGFGWLRG